MIPGTLICEAALRCEWNHVGSLEALAACQPAIIRTKDVERVLSGRSLMHEVSSMYAQTFHAALIRCKPPAADWPSDIKIPAGSYDEIVVSADASLSIFLSLIAHSMLRATRTWTSRINFGEIEQQVRARKSSLTMSQWTGARGSLVLQDAPLPVLPVELLAVPHPPVSPGSLVPIAVLTACGATTGDPICQVLSGRLLLYYVQAGRGYERSYRC